MIGLLFIVGWGGLLLLTFVLVAHFLSRPWHIGERIACTAMTLLIGLGIPFWDYIPAKMYFNDVCSNAGVKIVAPSLKGLKSEDLKISTVNIHHDWNVIESKKTISSASGEHIAVLKGYVIDDGHDGFVKPWMVDMCPRPAASDPRWVRAGHILTSHFEQSLVKENK